MKQLKGHQALELLQNIDFNTVLDVGCGPGKHSQWFKKQGKTVTSTDFVGKFDDVVVGDYMTLDFEPHDCVWCCHVLEHQVNSNLFLQKIINDCKDNGVIAITVPPLKHNIVGGHVSLWNAGLLLYNMVLAGLDCSNASVGCYGYNISVIVKKTLIKSMPQIKMGNGDIELLANYFPVNVKQGFDGKIINHMWI